MPTPRQSRLLFIALLGSSATATVAGILFLMRFDQTTGSQAEAPARWPVGSTIRRAGDRPTLLLFAHPYCGCTSATLGELARIFGRRPPGATPPAITVLFARPKGTGWRTSNLWDTARQLTGARLVWDDEGREAQKFGVYTSGEVLLYGRSGDLLFQGGVTGSRGHAGDNFGADHLATALDSERPIQTSRLVFGCALAETRR